MPLGGGGGVIAVTRLSPAVFMHEWWLSTDQRITMSENLSSELPRIQHSTNGKCCCAWTERFEQKILNNRWSWRLVDSEAELPFSLDIWFSTLFFAWAPPWLPIQRQLEEGGFPGTRGISWYKRERLDLLFIWRKERVQEVFSSCHGSIWRDF